jgi:hypothetical protein
MAVTDDSGEIGAEFPRIARDERVSLSGILSYP